MSSSVLRRWSALRAANGIRSLISVDFELLYKTAAGGIMTWLAD